MFKAWTEPQHLKHWSAPHGFKIPTNEGELPLLDVRSILLDGVAEAEPEAVPPPDAPVPS